MGDCRHPSNVPSQQWRSGTKPRPESQIADIELANFQVAEVDSIEVVVNFFETDVLSSEHLTYKDAAFVPTDVACIVHSTSLEVFRIDVGHCVAR
jgi:hypothetical protein